MSKRDYGNVIITCVGCGIQLKRNGPNHKRCKPCAKAEQLRINRVYHAKEGTAEKRRRQRQDVRERINAQARARRAKNPAHYSAYHKEWIAKNRVKLSMQRRARVYGLSVDDIAGLISAQGDVCPVCGEPIDTSARFHVDHDHETGAIRGILHDPCNKGIGMLGDNPDRCERAAAYLRTAAQAQLRSAA